MPRENACSSCGRPAVELVRYCGSRLCDLHFKKFVRERAQRELRKQCKLGKSGKIAVALSGGKDSAVALYILHEILSGRRGLSIEAITIDEGIAGYRDKTIKAARKACAALGVRHHIVSLKDELGFTLDELARNLGARGGSATRKAGAKPAGNRQGGEKKDDFAPCTYCGVLRRLLLNRKARKIGADYLATGLNLDDTAQSVLMNICRGDAEKLARMGPHTSRQPGLAPRIQPLICIPEKETFLYATLCAIPFDHSECPYAQRAQRNRFRGLVLSLEDASPGTRHAIVAAGQRISALLNAGRAGASVRPCPECGEPTGGSKCRACELVEKAGMAKYKTPTKGAGSAKGAGKANGARRDRK